MAAIGGGLAKMCSRAVPANKQDGMAAVAASGGEYDGGNQAIQVSRELTITVKPMPTGLYETTAS